MNIDSCATHTPPYEAGEGLPDGKPIGYLEEERQLLREKEAEENIMRVKIEGPCDLLRLEKCLQAALRHFTVSDKALDLPLLHGVNVYFTVRDDNGQEIELTDDQGNLLELLVFKDPNKVQRKARKAKVLSLVKAEEANKANSPAEERGKKPGQ